MVKKATAKKTTAEGAPAKKRPAGTANAPKPSVEKSGPNYDQPGAPWWKKFSTPSHG